MEESVHVFLNLGGEKKKKEVSCFFSGFKEKKTQQTFLQHFFFVL